jgi:hypothetical protein
MSERRLARARIARALRLPVKAQALAGLAWVLIGCAALAIRWLPARHYLWVLGKPVGAVSCQPVVGARRLGRARAIRTALRRAAASAPFRNNCLPQALAAAVLCRIAGLPSAAHLGTRLSSAAGMEAHAWLAVGPVAVSGGHAWDDYTVVACYLRG